MTTRHNYWKDWLAWALALNLGWGVLGQINIMTKIGEPFPGFFYYNHTLTDTQRLNSNTPHWWPTWPQDMGDWLLAVNGRPIQTEGVAEIRRAWAAGERTVQITTFHWNDGNPFERTREFPLVAFSWQHIFDTRLHTEALAVGLWLLAFMVYRQNPRQEQNRRIAWLMLCATPVFFGAFHSLYFNDTWLDRVFVVLEPALSWQWGALSLFMLGITVPTVSRVAQRETIWAAYALVLVASFFWSGSGAFLHLSHAGLAGAGEISRTFDRWGYELALRLLLPLGLLVLLGRWGGLWLRDVAAGGWEWWCNRHQPGYRANLFNRSLVQRQTGILLLGVAGASGILFPYVAQQALHIHISMYSGSMDFRALMLALPLAVTVVALRYKKLSQGGWPMALALFLMLSSFVSGVGAGLTSLYANPDTNSPPTPIIFGAVFVGAVLAVWQTSRHGLLDRLLNQTTRNYQAAQTFGQRIAARPPTTDLPTALVAELTKQFNVARTALWVWDDTQGVHRLQASTPGTPPAQVLPPPANPATAFTSTLPNPGLPAAWQALAEAGFDAVSVLALNGQALGVLAVSRRADEEIFDDRDLEVLDLLAQQAALFLLAEHQLSDLKRLSAALEQAQEVERFRVAQDLHDTVQQSLNGLSYSMSLIQRYAQNKPERVPTLAAESLTEIHEAIGTLYQIRNALNLSELRHGLALPVRQMAQRYAARWKMPIEIEIDEAALGDLPLNHAGAVYRVINQALDNVVAHARATQVKVRLWSEPDRVWLEVRDNGRGFGPTERAQAEAHGHMGLPGMKTRLEGVNGELHIISQPGAGTTVRGWVPVIPSTSN